MQSTEQQHKEKPSGKASSFVEPTPVIQKKLKVGDANDVYEAEADRVADEVVGMKDAQLNTKSSKGALVQRKCSACKQEESIQKKTLANSITPIVQRKGAKMGGGVASKSLTQQIDSSKGGGSKMDHATQSFMESRFGTDLSNVSIHTDSKAIQMSQGLNAQAFTVGSDIYFNEGKYNPSSISGKHLLAHELTHTIQQKGVQRKIQKKDLLCNTYNEANKLAEIDAKINSLDTITLEEKLTLIQNIKWVIRCGSAEKLEAIKTKLNASDAGKLIWVEANSAFGGFSGMYPEYYGGAKSKLKNLGVSAIEGYKTVGIGSGNSIDGTKLDQAATAAAVAMESTDILYFYGHQYAQYSNPGLFANGNQTRFVDFRKLSGKGDFSRVKLLISTSCATICKEAIEVFAPLFPNAVILGYRKSAPLDGGKVRTSFQNAIKGLNRPLLLGESVDVEAIIDVWKSTVKSYHPNESKRLPGYYKGGTVHYLKSGTWSSMLGTDAANSCRKKGTTVQEAMD